MTDTIKDVSTLTTIPEKTIMKLVQKFIFSICETVLEDIKDEQEVTELNIGLGTLYIKHVNDEIKFFILIHLINLIYFIKHINY